MCLKSHPTWVRGLKLELRNVAVLVKDVAPYVGAWIETRCPAPARHPALSHPTWVRGLKQDRPPLRGAGKRSHPTWVRGLKRAHPRNVRSPAGRTLRGCVD